MYKNRNTGTGNGMQGMRGMWRMLYFGECPQTFRGTKIPGNVAKHSGECPQIFREMSPNIPENVTKHSGKHSSNILRALNSQIQLILAYISILFQK